ncbi:MAG: hypothetical protein GY703_03590 [Gammaproteobacteria bacterium]|nr:hypothetical protein [Gammaproteobacteria bacterium]
MLNVYHKTSPGSSFQPVYEHRLALLQSFVDSNSPMTPECSLLILNEYTDCLERELSCAGSAADVGKVQEMLLELSQFVRSDNARIIPHEYGRLLERLTDIYAHGFGSAEQGAFFRTAADYADVVDAISGQHPACDYSEAVGQLLYYMGELFELRKGSWITIYEHLQSMSNSVKEVQSLKQEYLLEIQRWAEEGVANLFGIRKDRLEKFRRLEIVTQEVDAEIEEKRHSMKANRLHWQSLHGSEVISLDGWVLKKEIEWLLQERQQLVSEQEGNRDLIELIESNILEFQGKLKEVRRKYLIRPV